VRPARGRSAARRCALALLALACARAPADPTAPPPAPPEAAPAARAEREESVRPHVNDLYVAPGLDLERWTRVLEGESREVYAQRAAIVDAVGVTKGLRVADVGAGTGAFLETFVERVGERGRVFAVEISPVFLEHLRARATANGWTQVHVVHGIDRSVELPAGSIDLAFVCDTYHHFEYPRSTLGSLRLALVPAGRLAIVDFERIPGASSQWVLDHVRADRQQVIREIEREGFALVAEPRVDGLKENYVLVFERR
jgi:ubiquinone/menaquinone biosynthesis C-methylase UbiE